MPDKLKEGDEVVLRGKLVYEYARDGIPHAGVVKGNGCSYSVLIRDLEKVRPGTYEVTARDVAKMICRAMRRHEWKWTLWCNDGLLNIKHFKPLRRWVHCRLREIRRKRGKVCRKES